MLFSAACFLAMAAETLGHAVMVFPEPRKTGPAHKAACGAAVTARLESDIAGPIENGMEKIDADYNCDAFLCRGYQFEDNSNKVQALAAGDSINFQIDLIAGHTPGYSNVSVVDTTTNEVIGEPLKVWSSWPMQGPGPQDDVDFNVTIPDGLGSACDVAGKCVLQWFWYAIRNKQTYESCVDFYVERSVGGNSTGLH